MSGFVRIRFAACRIWGRRSTRCRRRRSPGAGPPAGTGQDSAPDPASAPSSGRDRARATVGRRAIASRTGRLNASDFPDAVPVVTITFSPRLAASHASAWWVYSPLIPRLLRAASAPGSRSDGRRSNRASRGGSVVRNASSSPARRSSQGRVTPRGTERTLAHSDSCRAGRRASLGPRRPRTGSPSGRKGCRTATGCRGWRRCRA